MAHYLQSLLGAEHATVPEVFEAQAAARAGDVLLRWDGQSWSYGEGWEIARRFAGWLHAHGHERRVAAYLGNRPEAVWGWLGTLAAGASWAPLHRGQSGDILLDMLARTGASLLVTDSAALAEQPRLRECGLPILLADRETDEESLAGWQAIEASEPIAARVARKPTDIACLMFTSGTTGRAKAVQIPHNQFCRGGAHVAEALAMDGTDRLHLWLPFYHLAGQLDMMTAGALAGARMLLYDGFSASNFVEQVDEEGATIFGGFTVLLEILLRRFPDGRRTTLRAGMIGYVPAALRESFEQRFEVELHDIYGMTEAEPIALGGRGTRPPPGSCGRASPDFEIAILDDDGFALAPGTTGEIAIRPKVPGVMTAGYEDDAEATLAVTRDLWFRTGDFGKLDEQGFLYFAERKKHIIRRRGENISPWELEHRVAGHPAVEACAAVAVPSEMGEDDIKLVIVPAEGAPCDLREIDEWCRENLPRFMRPRHYETRAELPLTDTGKVVYEALKSGGGEQSWDSEA